MFGVISTSSFSVLSLASRLLWTTECSRLGLIKDRNRKWSLILHYSEKLVKMGILPFLANVLQKTEGGVTDQEEPVCIWNTGMWRVHLASVSPGDCSCAGWLETLKFSDWSMSRKLKGPFPLHGVPCPRCHS